MNMGWERILPLKIYNDFKTWKLFCDVFVKRCDINFQTREKSPQYYTYAKLLKFPETGLPTLDLNGLEYTNTVTHPYPYWYWEMWNPDYRYPKWR